MSDPTTLTEAPDAWRDRNGILYLNLRKYPNGLNGAYDPDPSATPVVFAAARVSTATGDTECVCPTDDYCPKCHPRWYAIWQAKQGDAEDDSELVNLRRWKAEAMGLFDGLQDLGRALGLPLGTLITGPDAVAAATALRDRATATGGDLRDRVTEVADDLRDEGNPCGSGCMPGIEYLLRTALAASPAPVVSRPEAEDVARAYARGRVDGIEDCLPMLPEDDSGHLIATRDLYADRAASLATDPEAGGDS